MACSLFWSHVMHRKYVNIFHQGRQRGKVDSELSNWNKSTAGHRWGNASLPECSVYRDPRLWFPYVCMCIVETITTRKDLKKQRHALLPLFRKLKLSEHGHLEGEKKKNSKKGLKAVKRCRQRRRFLGLSKNTSCAMICVVFVLQDSVELWSHQKEGTWTATVFSLKTGKSCSVRHHI